MNFIEASEEQNERKRSEFSFYPSDDATRGVLPFIERGEVQICFFLCTFILLLLLLLLPGTSFSVISPDAGKGITMGFVSAVFAFFIAAVFFLEKKIFDKHTLYVILAITSLFLLPFIFSLTEGITRREIIGIAYESGTILSFLAAGIFFLFGFIFTRIYSRMPLYLSFMAVGAGVLVVVLIVMHSFFPSYQLSSLLGTVFSGQIFVGFAFLVSLGLFLFSKMRPYLRWCVYTASVLLLTAVLFFADLHILLSVFGITLFAGALYLRALQKEKKIIFAFGVIFTTLAIGVLGHSYIPTQHNPFISSFQEIRPSFRATMHAGLRLYDDSVSHALFGVGANRFSDVWALHRPPQINNSDLWRTDMMVGYGFIPSTAIVLGVPFTLLLIILGVLGLGAVFEHRHLALERRELLYLTGPILFFFFWLFVYVPHITVIVIGSLFFGCVYGSLMAPCKRGSDQLTPFENVSRVVLSLGLVGIVIIFIWFSYTHLFALREAKKALDVRIANEKNYSIQSDYLLSSISRAPIFDTLHSLIFLYEVEARTIIGRNPNSLSESEKMRASDIAGSAVATGNLLESIEPENYQSHIASGVARTIAGLLTADQAHINNALGSFDKARLLAPSHPLPYFMKAQTRFFLGDRDRAMEDIERALHLKPNYQEAIELKKQLLIIR